MLLIILEIQIFAKKKKNLNLDEEKNVGLEKWAAIFTKHTRKVSVIARKIILVAAGPLISKGAITWQPANNKSLVCSCGVSASMRVPE